MKQEEGIYIKVSKDFKEHINDYVDQVKPKGGLSGMVKRFLTKKTKFNIK